MTKKPNQLRIFNANRTTRKGGVVGRKRDRQVLAGDHEMPPGRKPNGAYEWDTTLGCWLNCDGSKFIAPPNTKPPKNVVGWDAREGEWIYALPKRQDTKRRRVFSEIGHPLSSSSSSAAAAVAAASPRSTTLSKKALKLALSSHKHKGAAASPASTDSTKTTTYTTLIPPPSKPLLVFVATRPPIPWSLHLKDRVFGHIDTSCVDFSGKLPLYVSRCVRHEVSLEESLSIPADKLIPSPPSLMF